MSIPYNCIHDRIHITRALEHHDKCLECRATILTLSHDLMNKRLLGLEMIQSFNDRWPRLGSFHPGTRYSAPTERVIRNQRHRRCGQQQVEGNIECRKPWLSIPISLQSLFQTAWIAWQPRLILNILLICTSKSQMFCSSHQWRQVSNHHHVVYVMLLPETFDHHLLQSLCSHTTNHKMCSSFSQILSQKI